MDSMASKFVKPQRYGLLLKLAVVLIAFSLPFQVSCLLKLTNAQCESHNKSWVIINECRMRVVKRGQSVFNFNATILHSTHKIKANYYIARKGNGYKAFMWNITFDVCQYLLRRNDPIANVIYGQFRSFSNINHTCPYEGDQVIVGLYPNVNILKILPTAYGEYAFYITWYFSNLKTITTNFFFEYKSR